MKFEIRTPDGKSKTRECDDKEAIKVMLKRGWKEVSSPKKSKK
tara:strand:+ start:1291 stop:1419 length:129 start_codon:yes stop_codon:yes gene_type:complete